MPVEGTSRAAMPVMCGSRARISSGPMRRRFSTPLSSPFFFRARRAGSSWASAATTSVPVGDVVLGAEIVHQAIAFDAERGFEGIFRVVDAGVDYAAVAGAGGHA